MGASQRYEVKAGDSLWKISKQHYGEGRFWTRLYVHNNRPDALSVTKKGIVNPNLIHPGQLLLLPEIPDELRKLYPTESKSLELANKAGSGAQASGKNPAEFVRMRAFPYKYKFDEEFGPIPGVGYNWKLKLSGTILVAGKDPLPVLAITNKSAELAAKKEFDGALAKSIHESKIEVDFTKKQIKYENMLTVKAGKHSPAVAAGGGISPRGLPLLKARIVHKGLAGTFDKIVYFTPEVKFDIEVEVEPPSRRPSPAPAPAPIPVPVRQDMSKAVGISLIAGGVVLIAATLVEDLLTAGAGIADDPLTLSAAFAAIQRGAIAF